MQKKSKDNNDKEIKKLNTSKKKEISENKNLNSSKTSNKKPENIKEVMPKTKTQSKSNSTKSKKTTSKSTSLKNKTSIDVVEYYDLPLSYNKTIVKILAQTPNNLFVYWEISDVDKQNLIDIYGDSFFENSIPVLTIKNETYNYSFEVEINDYANSWYIHVNDSSCKYSVEFGRKVKNTFQPESSIYNNYVHLSNSNKMEAPNDHILFDKLGENVFFKNTKTNIVNEQKTMSLTYFNNVGKIYNVNNIYKELYIDKINENRLETNMPSSKFK